MNSDNIQDTLFKKYYSDNKFSEVTSSHWIDFGKKTKVIRDNDSFNISAYGISNFHNKESLLGSLKHFPVDYLLSQMLKEYHARDETIQTAESITSHLNIYFDFDHAKHVLIYDLLDSYDLFNTENLICIIGDGNGFFGTLIKKLNPKIKILFINLGRNLLIDSIYFSIVFPNIKPMHFQRTEDRNQIKNNNTIFLEAERFELLQNLPISLFINVASMQEMNPEIINNYFKYMRTSKNSPCYFYCCNRLEKELPDGTLSEFMNYPWENSDDILIDELCPWYQKYPNWRPPFWRPFDGPHMHRLVNFK